MFALVVGMFLCVAISVAVLGYVARQARRESREFWTPEGERLIADVRRRGMELKARGEGLRSHAHRGPGPAEQERQADDPPAAAAAHGSP